ncbi:hypothetical protein CEXT_47601 [Caerostris extrusa]|uniref:Uncharacterized protein n=1 Tax=Caerostris extrusa TaxID=172846 RepID=A0AAV4QKS3_CAEEX|nr:hypothetical protein CEXT_47601 [Caerostris extrusa]
MADLKMINSTAVEVTRAPDYEKRWPPSPQRRRSSCRTVCPSYRLRKMGYDHHINSPKACDKAMKVNLCRVPDAVAWEKSLKWEYWLGANRKMRFIWKRVFAKDGLDLSQMRLCAG